MNSFSIVENACTFRILKHLERLHLDMKFKGGYPSTFIYHDFMKNYDDYNYCHYAKEAFKSVLCIASVYSMP